MDTRSKESRSLQVSCPVYCATRLCRHHRCRLYRHHRRCHECRCHLPRVQSDMRHLPTWAAPRYHRYPCQRLQPGCSSRPGKWAVWRNHRSRFSKHRPRIACVRADPASWACGDDACTTHTARIAPRLPAGGFCGACLVASAVDWRTRSGWFPGPLPERLPQDAQGLDRRKRRTNVP